MKSILDGAMRTAMVLTSRQKLTEATTVIQHALSQDGHPGRPSGESVDLERGAPPEDRESPKSGPATIWSASTTPANGATASGVAADGARKATPIGEVLHLLQRGVVPVRARGAKTHVRPTPAVPTPPGAQFLSKSYAGPAGSRDYKLFVPSNAKSRAEPHGLPLIVMLHGCTQNPDDFALGTGMNVMAEKRGCLVAYPQQSTGANNMACWNWFNLKDQTRDSGEPAILAGLTREIMAQFGVDPNRVFVAGLSAGGAMAAILAATYPDLFAAVGIHSGLPYGAATDLGSAFSSMRNGASGEDRPAVETSVRTIVFHGDADRTVHPANGELIAAAARGGIEAAFEKTLDGRSAGGVPYKRTVVANERGESHVEHWRLEGMGHAWSGGHPDGSYTNPHGPDASREMIRFFLD